MKKTDKEIKDRIAELKKRKKSAIQRSHNYGEYIIIGEKYRAKINLLKWVLK